MPSQSTHELNMRMDQLEQQNRSLTRQLCWMKRGFSVGVIILAAGVLLGAQVVQPNGIVLNDPQTGNRLIDMVTTPTGAAGFQVWDRKGARRILLGTNDQKQPGLTMWDSKGRIRIMVGINNEDQPGVTVFDTDGKMVTQLP